MEGLRITPSGIRILDQVIKDTEVSLPELAVKTRRTPNEVRLDLDHLVNLGLISGNAESKIKITVDGARAFKLASRNPERYIGTVRIASLGRDMDIDTALSRELNQI